MIVQQVKEALKYMPPFKKVVVAVSGGPDSVALAHVMIRLGYKVTLAHLDHGLRGKESRGDLAFVKRLAREWKVPIVTHSVRIRQESNLEAIGRTLRYAFLEHVRRKSRSRFIAVGHHRDDQVETVLMHMLRGAGWRGLSGMRTVNGHVIRPLLGIPRERIESYLKKQGLSYRFDSSNTNNYFTRNLLRNIVIPRLKTKHADLDAEVLQIARFSARQIQSLETQARNWIRKHVTLDSFDRIAFAVLPEDLQSEIIFCLAGHRDLYRPAVNEVKTLIRSAGTGKRKTAGKAEFEIHYDRVVTRPSDPARKTQPSCKFKTQPSCKLRLGKQRWGRWEIQVLGAKKPKPCELRVRHWCPGDRFRPSGLGGSKKLHDFFVDAKIPQRKRNSVPIFTDPDGTILAVGDLRVAEGAEWIKDAVKIRPIS